jgi:hypothetical protein
MDWKLTVITAINKAKAADAPKIQTARFVRYANPLTTLTMQMPPKSMSISPRTKWKSEMTGQVWTWKD